MNRADAPAKQAVPFGVNGQREALLPTTPAGDNTASYDAGFPPVTMILKAAGGLPPKGQDMNQILYELSALARWLSAGAINSYDATFSTAIGGYPKGAVVIGTDGITRYISTVDSNVTNPNTSGAGWFNISSGYLQTLNNLSEIQAAGTAAQASARTNLGLGSTAVTNIGTGSGMVPDMSSFTSGATSASFWQKLPSGMLMQYGYVFDMSSGAITINYPVPFTSQLRSLIVTPTGNVNASSINSAVPSLNPASGTSLTAFSVTGYNAPVGGTAQVANVLFYWEAIGV